MDRNEIINFLDNFLSIDNFRDSSLNGLQVEGTPEIKKIAFAVDGCLESFEKAAEADAGLLIVHHGIMWGKQYRITGMHAERFRCLYHSGLNLYGAHLPLDYHPEIGNNVILCSRLGIVDYVLSGPEEIPWFFGGRLAFPCPRDEFMSLAEKRIGPGITLMPYGPGEIRNAAVCSGGGAFLIPHVKELGYDTFVTGEPSHSRFHMAKELGLNVLCCGHYATEVFGLKALEKIVAEKFDLPTVFLEIPTGL